MDCQFDLVYPMAQRKSAKGEYQLLYYCTVCGRRWWSSRAPSMIHIECNLAPAQDGAHTFDDTGRLDPQEILSQAGVGTELHKRISALVPTAKLCCRCLATIQELNAKGPQWCENNTDWILDKLQESAKEQGFPFIRAVALRWLVNPAIRAAKDVR